MGWNGMGFRIRIDCIECMCVCVGYFCHTGDTSSHPRSRISATPTPLFLFFLLLRKIYFMAFSLSSFPLFLLFSRYYSINRCPDHNPNPISQPFQLSETFGMLIYFWVWTGDWRMENDWGR